MESRGVTGKPILWELDKEEMLSDLDTFLEEDANLRQTLGSTSIEVELKFGSEGNTPTVTRCGFAITFPRPDRSFRPHRRRQVGPGNRLQDRQT